GEVLGERLAGGQEGIDCRIASIDPHSPHGELASLLSLQRRLRRKMMRCTLPVAPGGERDRQSVVGRQIYGAVEQLNGLSEINGMKAHRPRQRLHCKLPRPQLRSVVL